RRRTVGPIVLVTSTSARRRSAAAWRRGGPTISSRHHRVAPDGPSGTAPCRGQRRGLRRQLGTARRSSRGKATRRERWGGCPALSHGDALAGRIALLP